MLTFSSLHAQSGVLKGLILDTGSGSVMPGAEVVLVEKSRIAFTDVNGIFSFGRVEPASIHFEFDIWDIKLTPLR